MRVTLSAAVTADGYMDDDSPRRLIISTPGDWEEVYRLRATHDAILAGAETLRRDDPSLLVRDEAARMHRMQAGQKPDIAKVTLTRPGGLRTLRARLFRLLPRSADPARSGPRRQGIPGAGQRRMGSQRAPEAMNRA